MRGREGSGKYHHSTLNTQRSSLKHGVIAGLIVVALGCAAMWWFVGRPGTSTPTDSVGSRVPRDRIAEVKPQIVTNKVEETEEVEMVAPSPAESTATKPAPKRNLGTVFVARTAKEGRVMTLMDGTVITNYPPKPIFDRDLERSLQVALRPGGMSHALLKTVLDRYSETEIIAMLQEMTIPNDDDNDNVKAIKNDVQDLKEKILLEVRSGRSVADVFDEISHTCSQENAIRVQAMKARSEAIRGGDAEEVRETVAAANEMLEKNGLPLMDVPAQYRDAEAPAETPRSTAIEVDDGFVPED